jgi:hypothetical protein
VARLATAQWGVVSRDQLLSLGLSHPTITRRIAAGRLHHIHPGVFAVGHPALRDEARRLAAQLSVGDEGVISHRSAAVLWDLPVREGSFVDVTTPRRSGRIAPAIALHRVRRVLDPADVCARRGLRCTSAARTIVDLADVLPYRELERAIEAAEVAGAIDISTVLAAQARVPGRRGARRLKLALAGYRPRPKVTRSELEARFLRLCRRSDVPAPNVNARVAGLEVDFTWPAHRLAVETDGRSYHATRAAFERDRRRDARLTVAGWRVVRFTWAQVVDEPAECAAVLRALL